MDGENSVKTVAFNKATGRYGIYNVTGSGDSTALGTRIYEFPEGTTNNKACAAFDEYQRTGILPG